MNAKARDLLGSVLMLVFVVSLWVQRDYNTPFGGIFPDIVMAGLVVLVVITIVLMFTPWQALKDDEEKEKSISTHWLDMAIVGIILFAWTLLLRPFGFILTGLVGFGTISWFLNERRNSAKGLIESALVGAGMVFLLVLVFEYGLKVPLPKGTVFG
jgi:hypothetical protein